MSDRRVARGSVLASLLIHVLLLSLTWNLDILGGGAAGARTAEAPLELFLVPEEPATAAEQTPGQPERYTEIPERLATKERPEEADFLALHDALAADLREGGEQENPGAEIPADVPEVSIEHQNLESTGGVIYAPGTAGRQGGPSSRPAGDVGSTDRAADSPQAATPGRGQAADDETAAARAAESGAGQTTAHGLPAATGESGDLALPEESGGGQDQEPSSAVSTAEKDEPQSVAAGEQPSESATDEGERLPELLGGQPPSILRRDDAGDPGDRGFDFDQLARGDLAGNAVRNADYNLNTWRWNYAPWMNKFVQDLRRNWIPPYAYYRLGILSGKTVMFVEVGRDGSLLKLEVLEAEGHESLHQASEAALRGAAPFLPLPPDFPEPTLEITLTLEYPAWDKLVPRNTRDEARRPSRRRPR